MQLKHKHVFFLLKNNRLTHQTNIVMQTLSKLSLVFNIEVLQQAMYNIHFVAL